MTKQIILQPRAEQDIDEHYSFIVHENTDAALRFFDAVRATAAQIARTPSIGRTYPTQNPRLHGIRKWAVKGFRKYLIFYFDKKEAVEVVRVLHASQDVKSILR